MIETSHPYPFADLTLARRLERAEGHASSRFVAARARVEPERGAAFVEVAGTYVMFDGVESPVTQTFGLGLSGEVSDAQLDQIETFFRSRGAPILHEVCPMADPKLVAALHARGYEPFEFTSVMYRPLAKRGEPGHPAPPGVTVRVAAASERERWAQTAAAGWSEAPDLEQFILSFGRIVAASDDSWPFLGELDGQMVATGSLIVHDGVALLAGASTIPAARHRGMQAALLAARLRHAADLGCDLAMMDAQSGSSSQRNAERNGFRIAYTRTKWRKPIGA
jgi:GNAT superfamily N-acetyltransferase